MFQLENSEAKSSLKNVFEKIFAKYGRNFEEDDEIDLTNLQVTKSTGHLEKLPRVKFGYVYQQKRKKIGGSPGSERLGDKRPLNRRREEVEEVAVAMATELPDEDIFEVELEKLRPSYTKEQVASIKFNFNRAVADSSYQRAVGDPLLESEAFDEEATLFGHGSELSENNAPQKRTPMRSPVSSKYPNIRTSALVLWETSRMVKERKSVSWSMDPAESHARHNVALAAPKKSPKVAAPNAKKANRAEAPQSISKKRNSVNNENPASPTKAQTPKQQQIFQQMSRPIINLSVNNISNTMMRKSAARAHETIKLLMATTTGRNANSYFNLDYFLGRTPTSTIKIEGKSSPRIVEVTAPVRIRESKNKMSEKNYTVPQSASPPKTPSSDLEYKDSSISDFDKMLFKIMGIKTEPAQFVSFEHKCENCFDCKVLAMIK